MARSAALTSNRLSVAERVAATGGRTAGFDYLRIGLAMSIILWHTISTSYGSAFELTIWRGPIGILMHLVLPMFFALSGFLVGGSLDRCPTLISFFSLRVLRILPALAVEVTLSALVFGPLLTHVDLRTYFSSPEFHRYFLNLVGDIHYLLPGVFAANPLPRTVNAQLWTVPFELQCYAALGALAVIGLVRRRRALLVLTIAAQLLWIHQAIKLGDNGSSNGASGPVLVISFLVGLLFHLYRERVPLDRRWFATSAVASLALSALPHGAYYLPIPATYLTIYLGLLDPPKRGFLFGGDYSYGLYLYGFPIQQAIASIGPSVHHWYLNAVIGLPVAFGVAFSSWHLIEKPALAQRRRVPGIERWLLAVVGRRTLPAAGGLTAPGQTPLFGRVGVSRWWDAGRLAGFAWGLARLAAGLIGVLLLVDAHEQVGLLAILVCFTLTLLPLRERLAAGAATASGVDGD